MLLPKRQPLTPADLAGKTVAIVGIGREGVALAHLLQNVPNIQLLALSEEDTSEAVGAWRAQWSDRIPLTTVVSSEDLTGGIDVALMSPGIAPHRPIFRALVAAEVVLSSGTDLFVNVHHDKMVGVTGSKGKSTTSALIAQLLSAHDHQVGWGGNVGIPLWTLGESEIIVAELSSYQCSSLTVSPAVAVVTALFEEHLDWHGSAERYFQDKLTLVAHGPEHVVIGGQSEILTAQMATLHPTLSPVVVGQGSSWSVMVGSEGVWITRGGEKVLDATTLPLLGVHNAWNQAIALEAAETMHRRVTGRDLELDTVLPTLKAFRPLPHRLEPVAELDGVTFINDSLATNPTAAAMALTSLRGRRVVALLGGKDRGVDQTPLRAEVLSHPPLALIGLPDSGPGLLKEISRWCEEAGVSCPSLHPVSSMDEAVSVARGIVQPGDVVLLSPGAPSFGRYRDYAERAEDFVRAITDSEKTR